MPENVIVPSSFEAAFLIQRGHDYRPQLKPTKNDAVYLFRKSKRLEADRQAFEDDYEIQEYVASCRRLKYSTREFVKEARKHP
jgi:hypothetical protein